MSYNVIFHPEAKKELDKLDDKVKLMFLKGVKKISEKPELGLELGNKGGVDLRGYRKIYIDKKEFALFIK